MKYVLSTTKRFDKALKRCQKRGYDMEKLRKAIRTLANEGELSASYSRISKERHRVISAFK